MTRAQLERFIEIRNKSQFTSNLQVAIDASSAGFEVDDLGPVARLPGGGWVWQTEHGRVTEQHGRWALEDLGEAN